MSSHLSPIGFWSYARQDDDASQGKLSSLRSVLMSELQQQYGREPVKIFQDVSSIPPGGEWEERIRVAMEDSSFLIPIITPNFLQSEWCNEEFLIFLDREKKVRAQHPQLKSQRLIFPIHYVDSFDTEPHDPAVLDALRRLQWFDFRPYRLKDYGQEQVRERLSVLARSVRNLLIIRLQEPHAPSAAPDPPFVAQPAPEPVPPQPVPPTPIAPKRVATWEKVAIAIAAALVSALVVLGQHHSASSNATAYNSTSADSTSTSPGTTTDASPAPSSSDNSTASPPSKVVCGPFGKCLRQR